MAVNKSTSNKQGKNVVVPNMNFLQVNNQLHLLGWDDFELDYCTLELAKTCFEADGLKGFEYDRISSTVRDSGSLSPK